MKRRVALISAGVIFVLNLIDVTATTLLISDDPSLEMNPLMAVVLRYSPIAFITVKMGLICFGLTILVRFCEHRFISTGFIIAFLAYVPLTIWYMFSLLFLY